MRRKPAAFRAFTGLTVAVFDQILADLEPAWQRHRERQRGKKPRLRKPGGGGKKKLALADRLLVLLI